jgi:hypothetical protein
VLRHYNGFGKRQAKLGAQTLIALHRIVNGDKLTANTTVELSRHRYTAGEIFDQERM